MIHQIERFLRRMVSLCDVNHWSNGASPSFDERKEWQIDLVMEDATDKSVVMVTG